MPNFTAGTSFTDGVTNDVTAAKLNALVADAVPTSSLSLNSTTGTIATFNSTTGTIATLNSTTGTIATLNSTTGTIATLNSTTGTIATLNSTTPTFLGAITASTNTINVGSGQIYKDASGNVGIGTASPAVKLDVQGVISSTIASKTAKFDAAGNSIYTSLNDGTKDWRVGAGIVSSGLFSIRNNTDALNAITIDSSGNVIISGNKSLISNGAGGVVSNTSIGSSALATNSTGENNTAIGANALTANTTGANNTAIGANALYSNTTGFLNTASGEAALYSNTTGNRNTASGYRAGYGVGADSNTTGSNNTFIGVESVGASATASNVITLGNGSIATLRCQVTSITALSDKRDKKDIENLSAGLDFVGKLRPVSFVWNTRDKAKVNIPDAGFIAQELLDVQEATGITIPNLVSQENPEKLEAAYGTLIPVLVQAIKELKAKVESLEEKLK
jgi:hypothetical protein